MADRARLDEGLQLLRATSNAFAAELEGLAAADWDRPTNCSPWTVRMLAAHMVRQIDSYLTSIDDGLRGVIGELESRAARVERMNAIAAQEPAAIVSDFREGVGRFERQIGALDDRQLDTLGAHSHGPRSAAWFMEQRLAEMAFHRWDLLRSLDRPADLGAATAAYLLPMLIETNFPAIVRRDGTGGQGSFVLATAGGSGPAWRLDFEPGGVSVSRDGAGGDAPVIEADPAALGLLIYGRQSLAELEQAGRLTIRGDRAAAARFGELYGGP